MCVSSVCNIMSFRILYLETCKGLNVFENDKLLTKINNSENADELCLDGMSIDVATCKVLGQTLEKDVTLRKLNLGNCFLNDEDLIYLLQGLEKNKFLQSLNLKGNKIRNIGVEVIGKFLRHNNHLKRLHLEWNALGVFPEKFSLLCEGIATNSSVTFLDLQHNQLNHVCAQYLASAIKRNGTLQKLDLRGNNFGLLGGRSLLKALNYSKSIVSVEISGNNIPLEINEAIDSAVSASAQRYIQNSEQTEISNFLAARLQRAEQENITQLKSYIELLEKKEGDLNTNERYYKLKIEELQNALDEKGEALERLLTVTKSLEKEFSNLREENEDLEHKLSDFETKNKKLKVEYENLLDEERTGKADIIKRCKNDCDNLNKTIMTLEEQKRNLEKNQVENEDNVNRLRNSVSKLENVIKKDKESFDEQISYLQEKHAETMKENQLFHQKEINRLQEKLAEVQNSCGHKLISLQMQKTDLENELREAKDQLVSEKLKSSEAIICQEKTLKIENEKIIQKMEERINLQENANKKLNDAVQEHVKLIYDLKTQYTNLDISFAEQEKETKILQKKLKEKDEYLKTYEKKIRLEVKEQIEELHNSRTKIEELENKNALLKHNIEDMENSIKKKLAFKNDVFKNMLKVFEERQADQMRFGEMMKSFKEEFLFEKTVNGQIL